MKKHELIYYLVILVTCILISCKKEEPKTAPVVSITPPSGITANSASSGGNVSADGGATVTSRGVCWSTGQNPSTSDSKTSDGSGVGSFSSSVTGLNPGVTYTLKAYAINSVGTSYSSSTSFTTTAIAPSLTTTDASSISTTSAYSGGNISSDGGSAVTSRGVCWSTTTGPTISSSKTNDGTGTGSFTSQISGLIAGTIYYLRSYATNSAGTTYGNEVSFTTTATLPLLTTAVITAIAGTTATSGGNITSAGGTITARGVCWSTSTNPTTSNNKTSDGTGAGNYTSNLTSLSAGTIYYVKAYATNSAGTSYGNEISFTSAVVSPVLTTQTITNITTISASSGGNITSAGGGTITARGVCWSTSTGPTINNTKTSDGTGVGSFVSSLTGLTYATTYYLRAYATNSAGTAYGNEVTFTTGNLQINSLEESVTKAPGEAPDFGLKKFYIITGSFSVLENAQRLKADLIAENFNAGIFINNNGMYRVSCYSSDDESVTRTKCAEIIQLFPKYSDLWLLIKKESGTVTDIDGNIYQTVIIGTQIWIAENLKTTKYNDGTTIPLVTDGKTWASLTTPGYCWYDNDAATNKNIYGAMYNGFTVNTGKLCPVNWHVPTDTEWTTLTNYLGGANIAGGKLKETGVSYWLSPNVGATNVTGFSARPGGDRINLGDFVNIGVSGFWWSSTYDLNGQRYRQIDYNDGGIGRYFYFRQPGHSVRCIKD
jgi:uncharacterized protein (TIGR02145 family)